MAKRFPVLLSPADALEWAAVALEAKCLDLQMLTLLQDPRVLQKLRGAAAHSPEDTAKLRELEEILEGVVDAPAQQAAMRAAVKICRCKAVELKLEEARARGDAVALAG